MTHRQRESVAKYLYDASKIVLATAVMGNLVARGPFDVITLMAGAVTAASCFGCAYTLEGETSDQ